MLISDLRIKGQVNILITNHLENNKRETNSPKPKVHRQLNLFSKKMFIYKRHFLKKDWKQK